jgi:hypothetical protein
LGYREKQKSLDGVMRASTVLTIGEGRQYATLCAITDLLDVPAKGKEMVVKRWKARGKPQVTEFIPYCSFIFHVNMFFCLSVDASLESAARVSHAVDLAYLYYLPFTNIFVSEDRLHEKIAPYFCDRGQTFLRGRELKADLKKLNDYYWNVPEDIRRRGMFSLASNPPLEGDFLVSKMWDKFWPWWREDAKNREAKGYAPPRQDDRTIEMLDEIEKAEEVKAPPLSQLADPQFMQITRNIPLRRGRWNQFPLEVEAETQTKREKVSVTQMISGSRE